jgi:hypothetical protein
VLGKAERIVVTTVTFTKVTLQRHISYSFDVLGKAELIISFREIITFTKVTLEEDPVIKLLGDQDGT